MVKKTSQSFEKNLERLEDIVLALEKGDVSLDDSLKLFEEGVKNIGQCKKILQVAEQKVQTLVEKDGDFVVKHFKNND